MLCEGTEDIILRDEELKNKMTTLLTLTRLYGYNIKSYNFSSDDNIYYYEYSFIKLGESIKILIYEDKNCNNINAYISCVGDRLSVIEHGDSKETIDKIIDIIS